MRLHIKSIFTVLVLVQTLHGFAQTSAPKYSNEFLTIGVGARALGMSLSQVASVNDVTSGYWNPAGLTGMKSPLQVAAMHSEYFAGIAKYDYLAVAKQIDSVSAVSVSLMRFGVDDIPNTTELIDANGNINYDRITTFSAADYALLISYGHKGLPLKSILNTAVSAGDGFRWGANAKVIYRHIGDFAHAWGFGLDFGMQYSRKRWHYGVVAKDITSTFNAWSFNLNDKTKQVFQQTGNEIPVNGLEVSLPRIILGVGRDWQWKKISLLAEANAVCTTDGKRNTLISGNPVSIDPTVGLELGYSKTIFLRMGVGNVQRITTFDDTKALTVQPNLGVGLRIRQFQLDYALSDIGNTSDVLYSNVFSLRWDIASK